VVNETNILNSILEIPVKPEPSFQVSHLERSEGARFDHVLQARVDSPRDETPSQSFEPKPSAEPKPKDKPVTYYADPRPAPSEHGHKNSGPAKPVETHKPPAETQNPVTHPDNPAPHTPRNPFDLPIYRLMENLNQEIATGPVDHPNQVSTDELASLFDSKGLSGEGSPAIDSLKELLAGLNIDAELIDQLVAALNSNDSAGVQGILNALRGLLNASNQVALAPGADIASAVTPNRPNQPEQLALQLLLQAGLSDEDAQAVIQQARAGTATQAATDNSTQPAKTVLDTLVSKLNAENSSGSGNSQNSNNAGNFSNSNGGETKNNPSGEARNLTGLSGDRLEALASLFNSDKPSSPGNAQTNPLIAKSSASSLLNLNAPGQPVPGALTEGGPGQAPAALADAAGKAVDFVKPAITETYNGRASMDKPITAQIIEKFSLRGFGNQREVQIRLDPPSLGTVRMNVSTNGDSVRATIVAENNIVKSVIESNLSQLKDSITHQGVKIDSFNVLVGGNASHSAEGHKQALDYLGQLGREHSMAHEQSEEIVTFHRPVFLNENQSISIFA
jgi:flagellar hook-length control protein FliK